MRIALKQPCCEIPGRVPHKRVVLAFPEFGDFCRASLLLKTIFHRKDIDAVGYPPFEELHGGTPRNTPCFYADGNPTEI